jgi:hypothetical protein
MESRKIEKDLVFYNPGKPGSVFTYKAGHFITDADIHEMQEHLKFDTGQNVAWVEERRANQRPRVTSMV